MSLSAGFGPVAFDDPKFPCGYCPASDDCSETEKAADEATFSGLGVSAGKGAQSVYGPDAAPMERPPGVHTG